MCGCLYVLFGALACAANELLVASLLLLLLLCCFWLRDIGRQGRRDKGIKHTNAHTLDPCQGV